ncbi:hypothetical protein SLS59_004285 [Nothophoma quercina]|uniref:Uncharacterized protein n=1 Tax=Nothophoma quercina TaxID=749835 RepID=A0ABR3RFG7_9PLEO
MRNSRSASPKLKIEDDEIRRRTPYEIPEDIVSPGPWYRIYMGQVCNKDGYYRQLWFFYGKHKDEQPKNILYWKPTNGQIAPEKSATMIDPATIPKQLRGSGTWAPVERYAKKMFSERKRNDDLKTERDIWNSRMKTEQKKKEAEASRKKPRNRKGLSSTTSQSAPGDDVTQVEGMHGTDEEVKWDNAAIERAWNAFRSPCSDFIYARMGEILQERFDTAIAVPKDVQERMRKYGKCAAMVDTNKVFTTPSWCTWKGKNGATSSAAKEEEDREQDMMPGLRSIIDDFTSALARLELQIKEEKEKGTAERGGSA